MPDGSSEKIRNLLRERFPLASQLRFSNSAACRREELPPIISLLSSMTNPDLAGDTCILLPSRTNVAFLVAVISALTASREHYSERLEKYISEGFEYGDHVRVLPNGEVYSFAGYFKEEHGSFFKLKFLDDSTNASLSFPKEKAVRLEKTNASRPKGKGKGWGTAHPSSIDIILGTETYGNHCLFSNEIMLVATKKEFLEFIERVHVSRSENEEFTIPLHEIIPWGVVKPDGTIEFQNNAAAEGQPIIAVSSRLEYVASACKANQDISPRVIVDGASRVKDLQAFDDVIDFSKLLVVADHSQMNQLGELASRNCAVWKIPDKLEDIIGSRSILLEEFQKKHRRASQFNLVGLLCESGPIEVIAGKLFEAEKILSEEEVDEAATKIISIAYGRLLDLSAILHTPEHGEFEAIRESVDTTTKLLKKQRTWISHDAYALLSDALKGIMEGISDQSNEYRVSKQTRLLEEIEEMERGGGNFAVVCHSKVVASSARNFLSENGHGRVPVLTIPEYLRGGPVREIVLTGWPRAINFSRLSDCYNSEKISCLCFGFEHKWFSGATTRRRRSLARWRGDVSLFKGLTGLEGNISIDPGLVPGDPGENERLSGYVEKMETTLSRLRKGSSVDVVAYADSREAKYVGFEGMAYSYLSRDRKIPRVSSLIAGDVGDGKDDALATIRELEIGDYVLWRANTDSDKDMVRLIAEQELPEGDYDAYREKTGQWKKCLHSLGETQSDILRKLKVAGYTKTGATLRNWLFNEDNIGPGDIEDLHAIAIAADDANFTRSIPEIWSAIGKVRSAHVAAGFKLSQLLFKNLPGQLPELTDTETLVDLFLDDVSIGGVWILQVEMIAEEFEVRPYWDVNRLLWDEI